MNTKKLFAILTLVAFLMTMMPMAAFAAPTVTPAGATAVTAGTATNLAGNIVITEAGAGEIGVGNIVITAPTNVTFTTTVTPDVALTAGAGMTFGAVTVTADTITIPVTAASTGAATITIGGVTKPQVNATVAGTYNLTIAGENLTATNCAPVNVSAAAGNEFTTTVTMDKSSLDADNDETAKFTIYVYDQYYNPVNGATVYFASDRGAADTFVQSGAYAIAAGATANVKSVTTTADGKAEIKVKSLVAGTAKIGIALADAAAPQNVYEYLIGNANANSGTIKVAGTETVDFVADTSAQTVALQTLTVRDRTNDTDLTPVGAGTSAAPYAQTAGWGKANKLDYFKIKVKVTNAQGSPVPNQEVQFSVDDADAWFAASKVTTDGSGIAEAKIYAQKADTYVVTYKTSSATAKDVYVQFDPADVSSILLKSSDNRVLAKDTTPSWKFEVQDSNGNKIDVKTNAQATALVSSIDSVTKPSGATIKKSAFSITADTDNNWVKIKPTAAFAKEGNYTARVTLANGQYAEFSWEIKAQGEIVDMTMSYSEKSVPLSTTVGSPTVTWVDAEGVEKDADDTAFAADGIKFTANDYTKMTGAINANTGAFTTTGSKDYVGELVITAYDNANKLSASFTVNVGRELASMVAEAPEGVTEVGKTAVVPVKFLDILGNNVAVGNVAVAVSNAYPTAKPVDATVSVEEGTAFAKKIKENGEASFEVTSNKAGEVTVFVAVTVGANIYSDTFSLTFGEAAPVVGASNVTMFINSAGYVVDGIAKVTDVAPFIQDSRTFVPVRMISEALGADVEWDAATQTVTIERADKTIEMTIGSNVLAVSDGSSIVSDVAPFIKDGRTVLPFRVIGEAFGATVDAVFATDGTVSAVTFVQ